MEKFLKLPNSAKAGLVIGGSFLLMGTSWLLNRNPTSNAQRQRAHDHKNPKNQLKSTNNSDSSHFSEDYDKYSTDLNTVHFHKNRPRPKTRKKIFLTDNEDFSSVNENFDEYRERIHSKIYNNSNVLKE